MHCSSIYGYCLNVLGNVNELVSFEHGKNILCVGGSF